MRVLREFDLATDGDRERRRAFSLQTRCVTALYERLFPRRYKTESCWKVYIRCLTANVQPHYRDHLGVYELDIDADAQAFFGLGDVDKKWWAFEQLQRGIEQLRRQTGWDEEPFAATAAQARALELRNVWRWKKRPAPHRAGRRPRSGLTTTCGRAGLAWWCGIAPATN